MPNVLTSVGLFEEYIKLGAEGASLGTLAPLASDQCQIMCNVYKQEDFVKDISDTFPVVLVTKYYKITESYNTETNSFKAIPYTITYINKK